MIVSTIGVAWREVQRTHWRHFIVWLQQQFRFGDQPADLFLELTGASLWVISAKIVELTVGEQAL